jgi:hypothetical protein
VSEDVGLELSFAGRLAGKAWMWVRVARLNFQETSAYQPVEFYQILATIDDFGMHDTARDCALSKGCSSSLLTLIFRTFSGSSKKSRVHMSYCPNILLNTPGIEFAVALISYF